MKLLLLFSLLWDLIQFNGYLKRKEEDNFLVTTLFGLIKNSEVSLKEEGLCLEEIYFQNCLFVARRVMIQFVKSQFVLKWRPGSQFLLQSSHCPVSLPTSKIQVCLPLTPLETSGRSNTTVNLFINSCIMCVCVCITSQSQMLQTETIHFNDLNSHCPCIHVSGKPSEDQRQVSSQAPHSTREKT